MRKIDYKTIIRLLCSNFVSSNLPVIIALVMLASTPFFILQKVNEIANQIAGYAFYFLIAGILWKAIQYLINRYPSKDNVPSKLLDSKT
jgi:hypothetical protein